MKLGFTTLFGATRGSASIIGLELPILPWTDSGRGSDGAVFHVTSQPVLSGVVEYSREGLLTRSRTRSPNGRIQSNFSFVRLLFGKRCGFFETPVLRYLQVNLIVGGAKSRTTTENQQRGRGRDTNYSRKIIIVGGADTNY